MISRIFKYLLLLIATLLLLVIIWFISPALWNRWVRYPGLESERKEFLKLKKETQALSPLKTFRGVMHVHSYWSHDSEGKLHDLVSAAKQDDIDFIFLTDHPRGDIDTLPHGYKGLYDNVLIEPGSEKQGFAAWPLRSTIIDWRVDKDSVAGNIVKSGGMIFYAHPEEPHNWTNPFFQGMEIYNFHADVKDETLLPVLVNLLFNRKYSNWAYRSIFDEQTAILAHWDSLNRQREVVGYSAVDTHENQNLRARYLKDGRVEWVGPDANIVDTTRVNFWNRWFLHEPDEDGWIFRIMLDTYLTGFNHITNYVLADSLTTRSLSDNIKKGHLYTAFKYLADAEGFLYYASDMTDSLACIMGDSISLEQVKAFRASSPYPGQFRLLHDGKEVDVTKEDGYMYSWNEMIERGAYRLEIRVMLDGKYVPWLFTNPIFVY